MDGGDPLLVHWLQSSRSSLDRKRNSTATRMMIHLGEGRRAKNAWLWSSNSSDPGHALSDTLLRVLHLPSAKGETAEQLEAKQNRMQKDEYRLHSSVLASASDYFKARLLNRPVMSSENQSQAGAPVRKISNSSGSRSSSSQHSEGDDENSSPQEKLYLFEERLAPSDVSAAGAVLRHMYTEQLTCDSPGQLVSVLKIADLWKATDTIDACRAAFSQLKPEDLDLDVIKQVYCLEGILRDVQNYADLVNAVQSRLVHLFQDIVEVVQNPSTRNMFLQLPFAAVVALLRSPQLVIDSEDTVVVAANLWITSGKGRNSTQEQRRMLAGVVNLSGLSPAYMCGVLPNLRWFSPSGQQFVCWTQAMPTAYFAELHQRLVTPKAKQVLCSNSSSGQEAANQQQPTPATSDSNPAGSRAAPGNHVVPTTKTATPFVPPTPASGKVNPASSAKPAAAGATNTTQRSNAGQLLAAPIPTAGRMVRDQNLEIECDIDFNRLKQYLEDGYNGLMAGQEGFRGIHVHSQCSYFKGFMWGIKLVFGFSAGHTADGTPPGFAVTPSPFASLPPGEDGIRPLMAPINVSFRCTMEGVAGEKAAIYANATYQGASFLRPGEDHVSSIGIANFFKRVPQQHLPESWMPFLVDGKLRLRLRVMGNSVE